MKFRTLLFSMSLATLASCACGAPATPPACDPVDCNDQDACTTDVCSAGECLHTAAPIALTPDGVCSVDTCDPILGMLHTPVPTNDDDACTVDRCDSTTGVSHAALSIDDADACTIDTCDALGGVSHTALSADDADACTIDTCDSLSGVSHAPLPLDDADACTVDACDPLSGPSHALRAIDDGDACTVDTCDRILGVSSTPVPVDDGNPLTVDACDPLTGIITHRCSDQVTTLFNGNPGADAGAYPAAGWWKDDTRANGTVAVDSSIGPPTGFGCTSAKFTTGASTTPGPSADKAQLISFARSGTPLSSINTISYWAYRSSASTGGPAVHLSLNVTVTGSTVPTGFATLVYEPYHQSAGNSAIQLDAWQHWNATATTSGDGLWWTNRISNGTPGSQSSPQSWAAFQSQFSDAKVLGYGFNVGSFNPNMVVAGDGLVFGSTTTDF